MIRWALLWISVIVGVSGLINWWMNLDVATWQTQLRYLSAIAFLLAIFAGSLFTLSRKRFYRKEWSFILLIITLGLFGVSVI